MKPTPTLMLSKQLPLPREGQQQSAQQQERQNVNTERAGLACPLPVRAVAWHLMKILHILAQNLGECALSLALTFPARLREPSEPSRGRKAT